MNETYIYAVCRQTINVKPPPGTDPRIEEKIHLVKLNEQLSCIPPGDDAMRMLIPVSQAYSYGIVALANCEASRKSGKCPKEYLKIP